VLAEVGYADALLVRELGDGTLELIDGHLRAETTPDAEVPVLIVDLDDAEAAKVLALHDPLAAIVRVLLPLLIPNSPDLIFTQPDDRPAATVGTALAVPSLDDRQCADARCHGTLNLLAAYFVVVLEPLCEFTSGNQEVCVHSCRRLRTAPLVQFENGAFSGVVARAAEETEKSKNLLGVLCV
jgi:hypothetical protein